MVKGRETVSERAIAAMHRRQSSGSGESPSDVQGDVRAGEYANREYNDEDRQSILTKFGHLVKRLKSRYEVNSGVPLAPPLGLHKSPSMVDIIMEQRRQLREEFTAYARDKGYETFDEAEDFDIDDDMHHPTTPWENEFEPDVNALRKMDSDKWNKLQARIRAARDARKRDKDIPKVPDKLSTESVAPREDAAAAPNE